MYDPNDLELNARPCDAKYETPAQTEYTAMTHQEIANMIGTSRERVRQIERRALQKLRKLCEIHSVNFDDLIPNERSNQQVVKYAWRQ